MKHGISFIKVNNTAIQEAISNNATKDTISALKAKVSWEAVYGFEYAEVSFQELSAILSDDYGFSPFRYKSIDEGAIYNIEKHPNAYGLIRGRNNLFNKISWVCLDIDDTTIRASEMHSILRKLNHHIAMTSDGNNHLKYRIFLELDKAIEITEDLWKPFIKSIVNQLGVKCDMLGRSQVFYSYKNREVYSTIDQGTISSSTHLKIAQTKVSELEEKRASQVSTTEASNLLQRPYSTFAFAYEADSGEGTNKLLAAIHKAKELGASREYCLDLVNSINSFWDKPMTLSRLNSTVITAI